MFKWTFILLCFTFLIACGTKNASESCSFAVCKVKCQNRAKVCHENCGNNCRHCCTYANKSALWKYTRYKNEICLKGGFLTLQLNSFRDPLQCRKTTCSCKADYRECMQACGGMVYKTLLVPKVCPG